MRTLKIDWPGLLTAIHEAEDGDIRWYLDVDTGQVVMGGDDRWGDGLAEDAEDEAPEHDPDRFLHVGGVSSRQAWRIRADFAATRTDPLLRDELDLALAGKGAFQRFKQVLEQTPGLRDAWFDFEHARAIRDARDWLESVAIEPSNTPPEPPQPAAPEPALVAARPAIGLAEVLLLGAPDGRTEVLEGKVRRQVRTQSDAEAQAVFRQVVLDIHALERWQVPEAKSFPKDRFTSGRYEVRQDGRLIGLTMALSPEQVRAFWR